ncbi:MULTISPECIES: glycerol-3-phosphate dehydrogenase/oxidase [Flavobacterium]|uniref:glycerol-3-phosphate dehydrogenase/oxidase n=1 Tax=Flavobacterium TaxID=237 RepID=UPI001FCB32B1|nr:MULTISPECIES: glycerol-3-phosphate dehydrogenase/oxidase [Flavobacterium]UOK42678.1 glycerol-3-phosphate dehydrogenase/oxidase [Flavobacterium enshiense]
MNREEQLSKLKQNPEWDVIIIGGGASGLGIALDSASRGYKTVLVEAVDFAKGTSSRSTKLAHGGIRYLEQLDIALIREALKERELMLKNAGHLVKSQAFVIPVYSRLNGYYFSTGLKIYDLLAGSTCFGSSQSISKEKTIELLPTIAQKGLQSGILYHDGQFDDALYAINLARTAIEKGACLLNYAKAFDILKNNENQISGITIEDQETGEKYDLKGKAVINATGVFTNDIMSLDSSRNKKFVIPSQGIHLVFDKSFLPSENALLIPKTRDGRVLFMVPWHDKVIVGTTDTPVDEPSLEPKPLETEINFILETAQNFLSKKPQRSDVLSVFAGLRPLALPKKEGQDPKEISRNHQIIVSDSGLISVIGGKWTTYRKIAEDVVDKVIEIHHLPKTECKTRNIAIHGHTTVTESERKNHLSVYGTDISELLKLQETEPELKEKLHPDYPNTLSEVVWSIRNEMARTVEDILARRLRLLFLDAQAAIECTEKVASLLSKELGKNADWEQKQIADFKKVAQGYLPH